MSRTTDRYRALPVQLVEGPDSLILRRGRFQYRVPGAAAGSLLPALEQIFAAAGEEGMGIDDLLTLFQPEDREAAEALLERLIEWAILVPWPTDQGDATALDVFNWELGQRTADVTGRLTAVRIAVVGLNSIGAQLAAGLVETGMSNVEVVDYPRLRNESLFGDDALSGTPWPAGVPAPSPFEEWSARIEAGEEFTCLIATSDFGGMVRLREWNRLCVERGANFGAVVLQDGVGYIGPLVIPGETPCFQCLLSRQNAALSRVGDGIERTLEWVAFEGQNVAGHHPAMSRVVADWATLEISRFFGFPRAYANFGRVVEIDFTSGTVQARRVLKVPRCEVCSPLNQVPSLALGDEAIGNLVAGEAEK